MADLKRNIVVEVTVRTGVHDGNPSYDGHCGKCQFMVRVPFGGTFGCSLFDEELTKVVDHEAHERSLNCRVAGNEWVLAKDGFYVDKE